MPKQSSLSDAKVAGRMQAAAQAVASIFPGRAVLVLVFQADPDQRTHYAGNCPREVTLQGLKEVIDTGLPGLAPEIRKGHGPN